MLDSLCHKFSSNHIHYLGRQEELANVVLPDPLGPIRATRDRLGMEIFMIPACRTFSFLNHKKPLIFDKDHS